MIQFFSLARRAQSVAREFYKSVARSGEWPRVRKEHLSKNPECAACGTSEWLQVHHQRPFHDDPSKELDPENLITLCEGPREHHFKLGHLSDWKAYNPHIVQHAAEIRKDPKKEKEILESAKRSY